MPDRTIRQSNKIECACLECGKKFFRCRAKVLSRQGCKLFCSKKCQFIRPRPRRPMEERFWEKVDKRGPDECWPWIGGKDRNGYGSFALGSRKIGRRQITATRIAFNLTYGEIEPGLGVLHKCDNRPCVNPSHLFLGTHQENMKDCISKGRFHGPPKAIANGLKTHCSRGHEFTPENTYKQARGRGCKQCRYLISMAAQRIRRAREKQERPMILSQ